jgi:protein-S-isoprenylcysteine O-methyltransferase Ste14
MGRSKILPPAYLLASIVVMVALRFLVPAARVIASPWNLLGAVPLVIGVMINVAADRAFHGVGTTVKPFQESSALVTTGVYRVSRHPMYLGFILMLIGIAIFLGSLTPIAVVPVMGLLLDRRFIAVEERMLEEKFGDAWLDYKKSVRRWI